LLLAWLLLLPLLLLLRKMLLRMLLLLLPSAIMALPPGCPCSKCSAAAAAAAAAVEGCCADSSSSSGSCSVYNLHRAATCTARCQVSARRVLGRKMDGCRVQACQHSQGARRAKQLSNETPALTE
jgi:hypothetical protein